MSSLLYNIEQQRPLRVAILRALNLGDLLCFIPAIRALKAASPSSSFSLIGLPWARSFARRFHHYFDDFIEFPGWPGLPERLIDFSQVPIFLTSMQSAEFDLAIQSHGSGEHVNDIITLFHPKHTAGFHEPSKGESELTTWLPYPVNEQEIWRWLKLACHLGGRFDGDHLEFPTDEEDFNELASIIPTDVTQRPYVVFHLGANTCRERLWESHNFVYVARHLYHRGYEIILTGTQEERKLIHNFRDVCDVPTINVCGKTSLGSLAALVQNAALILCHDTGISHLAVALETPSVIIHDRSKTPGWPPLNRTRHRFLCTFEPLQPTTVVDEIEDLFSWQASQRHSRLSRATIFNSLPDPQELL